MLTSPDQKALINEIMKQLKLQTDRRREFITRKSIVINPQVLAQTNPYTYGPYLFQVRFPKNPFITFGQARLDTQKGLLVVQPYVDSWVTDSGNINGFNLGVLALTSIPPGLYRHTITWEAIGRASLYKADKTADSWASAYNHSVAQHITFDEGTMPKPG